MCRPAFRHIEFVQRTDTHRALNLNCFLLPSEARSHHNLTPQPDYPRIALLLFEALRALLMDRWSALDWSTGEGSPPGSSGHPKAGNEPATQLSQNWGPYPALANSLVSSQTCRACRLSRKGPLGVQAQVRPPTAYFSARSICHRLTMAATRAAASDPVMDTSQGLKSPAETNLGRHFLTWEVADGWTLRLKRRASRLGRYVCIFQFRWIANSDAIRPGIPI